MICISDDNFAPVRRRRVLLVLGLGSAARRDGLGWTGKQFSIIVVAVVSLAIPHKGHDDGMLFGLTGLIFMNETNHMVLPLYGSSMALVGDLVKNVVQVI